MRKVLQRHSAFWIYLVCDICERSVLQSFNGERQLSVVFYSENGRQYEQYSQKWFL
jgi:hypothetical protein